MTRSMRLGGRIRRHRALGSTLIALAGLAACDDGGTGPGDGPVLVPAERLGGEFEGTQRYAQTDVVLQLLVDAPIGADSVRGWWAMHYTLSTASDLGRFVGTYQDGELVLTLTTSEGCQGGYTVRGTAQDTLGYRWMMAVEPTGQCHSYAVAAPIAVQRVTDIGGFPN